MNFTNDEARHTKDILFKSLKQISQIAAGHFFPFLLDREFDFLHHHHHSAYSDRAERRIAHHQLKDATL